MECNWNGIFHNSILVSSKQNPSSRQFLFHSTEVSHLLHLPSDCDPRTLGHFGSCWRVAMLAAGRGDRIPRFFFPQFFHFNQEQFPYPLVNERKYGKSQSLIGKSTIDGPFSIAMLNYQRVYTSNIRGFTSM